MKISVNDLDDQALEWAVAGAEHVITYTLASESGVSLRAAGWQPDAVVRRRAGGWSCPSRPRQTPTPEEGKVRWRRQLVKRPRYVPRGDAAAARMVLARWAAANDALARADGALPMAA